MDYTILHQKPIVSIDDLADLGIIDWQRTNGTSRNPYRAIIDVSSWMVNRATLTVVETDLRTAPAREDWPGWEHAGKHVPIGRAWWNSFHHMMQDCPHELMMSDEPDFWGWFADNGSRHRVFGDIGQVSVSAFALTMRKVHAGDLWISLQGMTQQCIIEWQADNASDFACLLGLDAYASNPDDDLALLFGLK